MILTVDVGTTNCKAAAFTLEGKLLASASRAYPIHGQAKGLREHRPEDWWRAMKTTLRETLTQTGPQEILGLGISGRGAGGVFLDRRGRVLAPSWLDQRHAPESVEMGVYASEHTPWAVGTTSLNLAARALHLKAHDPTVLGKTAYLGGVKDYLLLRLTGNWVTDSSSGPPDGEWISELFGYAGINAETLPGILPAGAIAGRLTDKAASDIGLPSGLPVSVGAMDGVCASIGAGVVSPGDACITLGTNGVLRLTSRFPIRSGKGVHSFFYRFIDDLWATGGDVASAGAFIQQLGRVLGSKNLESLDAKASKVPAGSQGLVCVPLPVGMVSPRLMPFARASFSGIGLNHGPEHLFRAAMEGVACSLRDIRDMAEAHGINVAYARITGGGARSGSWPQIISSMLGIPVSLVEPLESNRGAGVLLVVAMGIYPSVQEACSRMVRTTRDLAPVPGHALIYEDTWRAYKRAVEELS